MNRTKNKTAYKNFSDLDFVHTGPGTLAGRYMRLFWQPVYRGEDLPRGHAKPIRIMGEDFTLYRGESGRPYVVAFRCAHRGTQLSTGCIEGDFIRCSYHGWKYNSSGECVEQPAEDEGFAKKVRIKNYPTEEYLGLIFAYLGSGKPPPLPRYPAFEKAGVLWVLPSQIWPCNYFQLLENHGDTVHVAFTHRDAYLSADTRSGVPIVTREESEWGLTSYAKFPGGVTNIYQVGMPNIHELRIPAADAEATHETLMRWTVPLDDERSLVFRLRSLPVTADKASAYLERRAGSVSKEWSSVRELGERVLAGELQFQDLKDHTTDKVVLTHAQDYAVQVGQGPIPDRTNEHLGRSDVGVILFRKVWVRELNALKTGRPLKKWLRPETMNVLYDPGNKQQKMVRVPAPRQV